MLFSLQEIIDILIAVVAGGFIFMDQFKDPHAASKTFAERLLFAVAIAAPAIVLHELGHKFVAMTLGYQATFHAAYGWLALGVVLKLVGFPLLLIVPAYVSFMGASGIHASAIAFAGPAINGLLWLGCSLALRFGKYSRQTDAILYFSKTINMFLFLFNLIPIPPLDGFQLFSNLF